MPEGLEHLRRQLDEMRRTLRQAPLAARLRQVLDAPAARAMSGLSLDAYPDLAAGRFLELGSRLNETARHGVQQECYARAVRVLAIEAPEFAELADALDALVGGIPAPLLQPPRFPRRNKPEPYLDLALYAAVAFFYTAADLHKRGEKLTFDRVMAEVFGESRTGTEDYAGRLREPWLPLCGRSWRQARFIMEAGLSLFQRGRAHEIARQFLELAALGVEPPRALAELACWRSTLGVDKAAAAAAWTAAGVKPQRRLPALQV
jgi:hypothetical protein